MLLDELGAYLAGAGLGLTLASNLFIGRLPDTPNAAVSINEYSGLEPEYTLNNGLAVNKPRVQVLVRAADYSAGATTAKAVWNAFRQISQQTLSGVLYHSTPPLQDWFFLERDGNERPIFAFNVQINKAYS